MVKLPLVCTEVTPLHPQILALPSAGLERPTFPGTRLPAMCTTPNPSPPSEVDSQEAHGLSERESPVLLTALGKKPAAFSWEADAPSRELTLNKSLDRQVHIYL